jgi:hypothetical protein
LDVLDMLVRQFVVGARDGWREALASGRERWRRTQTGVAVRDTPKVAARVLRSLGYDVRLPPGTPAPADNPDRLREL